MGSVKVPSSTILGRDALSCPAERDDGTSGAIEPRMIRSEMSPGSWARDVLLESLTPARPARERARAESASRPRRSPGWS